MFGPLLICILTAFCYHILDAAGNQLYGIEVTNSGYHLYDVRLRQNTIQGYLYRRGKIVTIVADADRENVNKEMEFLMEQVYQNVTGEKSPDCCSVIDVERDLIGTLVTITLTNGYALAMEKDPAKTRNAVLKTGLQISGSSYVELNVYDYIYNNGQVVLWSDDYKNICGSSYDQIASQLQEMIQNAIQTGINSQSTFEDERYQRHSYYHTTEKPIRQNLFLFRRARLCQSQSLLAAKATLAIEDDEFRRWNRSNLYKRINNAIFLEGIRRLTTDHFTLLRPGELDTQDSCE